MVDFIAIPALLAGLYALWIVGWPDALRLTQGVRHVYGQVVRHDAGGDGYVAIYAFTAHGRKCEVRAFTGHTSPTPPIGTRQLLGYPTKRPDLARPPQTFARSLMYAGFAAWLGFFSDLLLGWL